MQKAHDWAVAQFEAWGIEGKNEQWGEWRGWERGITHIDMVEPWVRSLSGTQLAWSPPSPEGGAMGEVIAIPKLEEGQSFKTGCPV